MEDTHKHRERKKNITCYDLYIIWAGLVALFGFLKTIGAFLTFFFFFFFHDYYFIACSFIHRLFCAVLLLFFSWDSNLSVFCCWMLLFDSIPIGYKFEAGWVLVFVVWLWDVVVGCGWRWLFGDDLSSVLCRGGSSSLAFPNMKIMVEVGRLMLIAFLFVAASGHCCHCLALGRQGQIVVVHGGARSGDHVVATFHRAILVDVASGAVSFTVGRFVVVVVASASTTITITSTSRCCWVMMILIVFCLLWLLVLLLCCCSCCSLGVSFIATSARWVRSGAEYYSGE